MNTKQKQTMLIVYAIALSVIFLPEIARQMVVLGLMEDSVAEDICWFYEGGGMMTPEAHKI